MRAPPAAIVLLVAFAPLAGIAGLGLGDEERPVPSGHDDAPGAGSAAPLLFTNVATGFAGAEPTIGITPSGAVFTVAYDDVLRSLDGGASWERVRTFDPLVAHDPFGQFDTADPMLWVDPVTGRVFVSHLFPGLSCSIQAWSDDDGETWIEKPLACGIPGVDHPKLSTGPFVSAPGLVYPNAVYYCYNKGVSTNCAVSLDGGLTYPIDRIVAAWPIDGCGGISGHQAAGPDGTLYVPFQRRDFPVSPGVGIPCDAPHVGVSTDNGLTWSAKRAPVTTGAEGLDPDMTVTPDGTAYLLYQAADHLQYLLRSTDRFETWEGPWLASAPDVTSTAFSAITSDAQGTITIAYLGTRDASGSPNVAPDTARWHLHVARAVDVGAAGPAWEPLQATPDEDPVQIGCVWLLAGDNPCRNLLDFIDATAAPSGRVYVAYTDGCTTGCAGDPLATAEDSRASEIVVGWTG